MSISTYVTDKVLAGIFHCFQEFFWVGLASVLVNRVIYDSLSCSYVRYKIHLAVCVAHDAEEKVFL